MVLTILILQAERVKVKPIFYDANQKKMFDCMCLWKQSLPLDAGRNKMFAQGGKNLALHPPPPPLP